VGIVSTSPPRAIYHLTPQRIDTTPENMNTANLVKQTIFNTTNNS